MQKQETCPDCKGTGRDNVPYGEKCDTCKEEQGALVPQDTPADDMKLMLDLETLGTGTLPVILSIGWCLFTETEIVQSGAFYPTLDSQQGSSIDADTVMWWLRQDKEAQDKVTSVRRNQTLKGCLKEVIAIVQHQQPSEVWCNGASFDLRILREAYKTVGYAQPPWPYYAECCMRALRSITDRVKPEIPHCAQSDAVAQAQTVMQIWQEPRVELTLSERDLAMLDDLILKTPTGAVREMLTSAAIQGRAVKAFKPKGSGEGPLCKEEKENLQ